MPQKHGCWKKCNSETVSLREENSKKNIRAHKRKSIWRIKTNEELHKLIKHKNIVDYIKAQRLSWFGYVQRMSDTRTFKKIFNYKPLTKRSQGRPKYRWEDNIKQDICQMNIKKLDILRPGSREMERGRWEGQNFQPLKEVQRLEDEDVEYNLCEVVTTSSKAFSIFSRVHS